MRLWVFDAIEHGLQSGIVTEVAAGAGNASREYQVSFSVIKQGLARSLGAEFARLTAIVEDRSDAGNRLCAAPEIGLGPGAIEARWTYEDDPRPRALLRMSHEHREFADARA